MQEASTGSEPRSRFSGGSGAMLRVRGNVLRASARWQAGRRARGALGIGGCDPYLLAVRAIDAGVACDGIERQALRHVAAVVVFVWGEAFIPRVAVRVQQD